MTKKIQIVDLKMPDFVHCELPIKDGSFHDYRTWIYCPQALSLIEVIPEAEMVTAIDRSLIQKKFLYEGFECEPEEFRFVITQNNCELAEVDPQELLQKSWDWYVQYLIWEDAQEDE